MAYVKTTWVNGTTPLNATNMNKIEDGISSNDTAIASLSTTKQDVITAGDGITKTGNTISVTTPLPDTSGNAGKFLKAGSSGAVWAEPVTATDNGTNWTSLSIQTAQGIKTKNVGIAVYKFTCFDADNEYGHTGFVYLPATYDLSTKTPQEIFTTIKTNYGWLPMMYEDETGINKNSYINFSGTTWNYISIDEDTFDINTDTGLFFTNVLTGVVTHIEFE